MQIRWKILRRLTLLSLLVLSTAFFASEFFILNNYRALESNAGEKELNRILNIIEADLTALSNAAINEAHWDAAYQFAQQPSADFIASDMLALDDLDLDLVVYLAPRGDIVYAKHLLQETGEEAPLPAAEQKVFSGKLGPWVRTEASGGVEGLSMIGQRPLLVSAQPILTSEGEGPAAGSLIIGRWFDEQVIGQLSNKIKLDLTLQALDPQSPFPEATLTLQTSPDKEQILNGKALLRDLHDKPILTLSAELPRTIYLQGKTSVSYFLLTFAIGTLLSALSIYLFIDKWLSAQERATLEIEHLAYHDALTGLPNRTLLKEFMLKALSNTERRGDVAALMFMDLDRFKQINDTYGHTSGDTLLASAARWLSAHVRQGDMVARIGGDEFVIFLASLKDSSEARLIAQKLLEIKHHPFELENNQVFVSSSIGVALFPEDGDCLETLQKLADTAMHEAKRNGRSHFQFASSEMNRRLQEQNRMEADLRRALQEDELYLVYQPQIDVLRRRVTGVEALLRWQHPEQGEIAPAKFIPLAEDSGLIHAIGEWVLRTACKQITLWSQNDKKMARVALNFSSLELTRPGFIAMVDAALSESGIDPGLLEFELTESVLMDDVETIKQVLLQLRERRISLALDDFGTGYSSLSYLKSFPIQHIKVDRSFVRELGNDQGDMAIVEAIIAMAASLKMEVSAEGVETAEQLSTLSGLGCSEVQGYYFAKPMTSDDLKTYSPAADLFLPAESATGPKLASSSS